MAFLFGIIVEKDERGHFSEFHMEGGKGVSASSYDNAEKFESLNGRNLTSIALLSFIQLRSMKSENAMQRNGKEML